MNAFPYPLEYGWIPSLNRNNIGFHHATGFIWNARFNADHSDRVDPFTTYGLNEEQADYLTKLNRLVAEATAAACTAAIACVTNALPSEMRESVELVLGSSDCHRRWSVAVGIAVAMAAGGPNMSSEPARLPTAPGTTEP